MVLNDTAVFLKKFPPFQFLDEATLQNVSKNIVTATYAKDTFILRQDGPPSEYLRIIKQGGVKVYRTSADNEKVYGPKGVGALYVRRRTPPLRLAPLLHGGGHEGGLRSGTPNVPGAVGLARALEIAGAGLIEEAGRLAGLRDELERRIADGIDGCTVNGSRDHRLPNTVNLSFEGIEGDALLVSLPDLAVSTGSACASNHPGASPVLRAMGVGKALASASIRVSLGRFTTADQIEHAARRIVDEVVRLRSLSRRRR